MRCKLRKAIQNKRRANATKELLASFKWDVLNHPAHSPDLVPSDYYLFTSLKLHVGGKRFSTDEEVKEEVEKRTKELARNYFEEGIKLVPRFTTCIERNGDYVEKYV